LYSPRSCFWFSFPKGNTTIERMSSLSVIRERDRALR
jgi:hypothetical protein